MKLVSMSAKLLTKLVFHDLLHVIKPCNHVITKLFQMLLEAMDKKLPDHKHYSSRQLKPMDKELQHKIQFKIKHYAGDVIYNINGFLDKNKDTLFQDFKRLLYKSSNPIISKMWPEGAQNILKVYK